MREKGMQLEVGVKMENQNIRVQHIKNVVQEIHT